MQHIVDDMLYQMRKKAAALKKPIKVDGVWYDECIPNQHSWYSLAFDATEFAFGFSAYVPKVGCKMTTADVRYLTKRLNEELSASFV